MTSRREFDAYVTGQRHVRDLSARAVRSWWSTVADASPAEVERQAMAVLPVLAATYGQASSVLAADFYETARRGAAQRGRYTAVMAESVAADQAAGSVGWAMAPLASGDVAGALSRALSVVDAAALQDGRNTVTANAARDGSGPRWARVAVGTTCAWCVMLAGRGAVYRSARDAGAAHKFHAACDCQAVPSWRAGKDLPPQADEHGAQSLYQRAVAAVRDRLGDDVKPTVSQVNFWVRRLDDGQAVTDGVPPDPSDPGHAKAWEAANARFTARAIAKRAARVKAREDADRPDAQSLADALAVAKPSTPIRAELPPELAALAARIPVRR